MTKKRSNGKAQGATRQHPSPYDNLPEVPEKGDPAFSPVIDRIYSDWAPGMPVDLDLLPTTLYQLLEGRVFTLMTWSDESTARGEVPLQQLVDLLDGKPPIDGWYSTLGEYIGEHPPGSLLAE